ncbi:MAG: SRPBCC domain-containing protein [Pseudomonadota bacterium]
MTQGEAATARHDRRSIILVVRRTIEANAERLFAAWTQPDELVRWWGPSGITCPKAEIDLRVGGTYRIANEQPGKPLLWIVGEFERIEPPRMLVYSWRLEPGSGNTERVSVRFVPKDAATEVIITHERIANETDRDEHEQGWFGCLDGLAALVEGGHTNEASA